MSRNEDLAAENHRLRDRLADKNRELAASEAKLHAALTDVAALELKLEHLRSKRWWRRGKH